MIQRAFLRSVLQIDVVAFSRTRLAARKAGRPLAERILPRMVFFKRKSRVVTTTGFIETLEVCLTLQHGEFGSNHDRAMVEKLATTCLREAADEQVSYKGDEYAEGSARMLFACPNALVFWETIRSVVLSNFTYFPIQVRILYDLESAGQGGQTTEVHRRR